MRPLSVFLGVCLLATGALAAPPAEYDECDAHFIAFIGADAYQFSPRHDAELGSVRLFSVLSYQRAAALGDPGRAFWKLEVSRADGGKPVHTAQGTGRIDSSSGRVLVESFWDGRDGQRRPLPDGTYTYTFKARFLPDRLGRNASSYDDLAGVKGVEEAQASTDRVVVDSRLPLATARRNRDSLAASTCQTQQNAPLQAGLGYNYYYGSTHSHSNWSDGGQPTTACSSGNGYGTGTYSPADVFNYARNVSGLDFWVVNEHNHLIQDALANLDPPVTEAKVRQKYQDGRAAANAATVNGSFVAIYGMEWGVTSNSDQGHVTLLETPTLFGWESCTNCNGPATECTPGTNCFFDVFTPKRYGYLSLYQRSVENPSPQGALGIFCHPSSGNFDNFAFDSNADNAMQGIAIRSGLAFANGENCADANVASTDYTSRFREALNRGFHVGPVADHDSHCNNFGQGIPNRTVYLVPNATSPALTKANLLAAHRARHFFATEDPNAQLVFTTNDGHLMGDIYTAGSSVQFRIAAYDPNGDAVQTIELWRGQIGAGVPAAAYQTSSGSASFTFTESLSSGSYWYYAHVVQADGHDLWSAPMWITFSGATPADFALSAAPASLAVNPGSSGAATLTLASSGGFNSAVGLSASGLPSGVTASFAPASVTPPANGSSTSALTLTVSASAVPGTSTVTITGTGGGKTHTTAIALTVNSVGGVATYDAALKAPKCAAIGTSCDSGTSLLNGRAALGPEPNQPNTINSSCADGTSGTFHTDESNDRIKVVSVDGTPFAAGKQVRIEATVWAYSSPASDKLDLYYAANANSPTWTLITTLTPSAGGAQTLTATYTLPTGSLQAVRANFRYNGSASSCSTGSYDDHDDLIFAVGAGSADTTAPTTSITSPTAGATVSGTTTISANASDNVAVSRVDFLVDGVVVGNDTTSPYSYAWATGSVASGSHSLTTKAYDAAGNVGTSAAVSVTVSNSGPVTVFSDNAESATTTFVNAFSTTTTQWTRITSSPYAGSYSWKAGSSTGGNYGNSGNATLTTPTLNLSGATTANLSYAFKYNTEASYDFFKVRISTDGGTTWTNLVNASGASSGYSSWAPLGSISLNSYVGQTNVKVQFQFTSDGSVTVSGAWLDAVTITKQ